MRKEGDVSEQLAMSFEAAALDLEQCDLEHFVHDPDALEHSDLEPSDLEPGDLEPGDLEPSDLVLGLGPDELEPEPLAPYGINIVKSKRSRKTVTARLVDGVIEVSVPRWMSRAEAETYAENMRARFEKKRAGSSVDLAARARQLCRAYALPKPGSIRWVTNQKMRWGSCTPDEGSIRINHLLATVPLWVLDYVIVHELAHFVHGDHSPAFWDIVARYPKTERARGFLEGYEQASNSGNPIS
jgi:Protein of unknown function DUF45